MGHDANQFAEPQEAYGHLNQAAEDDRGKQVANPVIGHQRNHHDAHRSGRPRDHAGASAEDSSQQTHHKRRVEPHQGRHTREEGEGHRFRHKGQSDGDARENVSPRGPAQRRPQLKHAMKKGSKTRGRRQRTRRSINRGVRHKKSLRGGKQSSDRHQQRAGADNAPSALRNRNTGGRKTPCLNRQPFPWECGGCHATPRGPAS